MICRACNQAHFGNFCPVPNRTFVPNKAVSVPNKQPDSVPNKNRVSVWKSENKDRYNAYMREYMARKRAA